MNNQECEVLYVAVLPQIADAEKVGSFYSPKELFDMDIKLKPNYEKAIFQRGRSGRHQRRGPVDSAAHILEVFLQKSGLVKTQKQCHTILTL